MKGGITLSSNGYLQVRAYTSNAEIPLKDVAITVTDSAGSAIAMRLTNRSGLLDEPITIPVPPIAAGQTPDTGIIPFSTVTVRAYIKNYEEITAEQVQLFPNTVTIQNLEMIPISELPDVWNQSELFRTLPQNL